MAEFNKKIATEAEFFEIIKPFDDVPSELSNGICLRKDKIQKYTEKTFDSLNSYTNNQLVPLDTFIDITYADYLIISFEWEKDGDLDCIVKPSNFHEDYIGIGFGINEGYDRNILTYNGNNEVIDNFNRKPDEIMQWSGDVTNPGGEYFLIEIKKLKDYKKKYGLTNNYFDFDVYAHWYSSFQEETTNITLKIETFNADNAQKVDRKPFEFTNGKKINEFIFPFKTNAKLSNYSGMTFLYDLVKRIRCYSSYAIFLPNNFPKIQSLEDITAPPLILVNGVNKSISEVKTIYDINNLTQGDKIKITFYPYTFKKTMITDNGAEQISYEKIPIKILNSFSKPSSNILTCNYQLLDNNFGLIFDISIINFTDVNHAEINFDFLGKNTSIKLWKR